MTDSEYKTLTGKDLDEASIPIHRESIAEFSNDKSTLKISHGTGILYGPTGFVAEEISKEAEIIVKPQGNSFGFVVEKSTNGKYIFRDIFNCNGSVENGDPCIKYGYNLGLSIIKTEFTGNEADRRIMQDFYKNEILNKNFSLYQ